MHQVRRRRMVFASRAGSAHRTVWRDHFARRTGLTTQIMNSIQDRIRIVQSRIEAACLRSARDPLAITLIAVSKAVDRRGIDLAYAAGLRQFGENRVQDAARKFAESWPSDAGRHMIGSLQS